MATVSMGDFDRSLLCQDIRNALDIPALEQLQCQLKMLLVAAYLEYIETRGEALFECRDALSYAENPLVQAPNIAFSDRLSDDVLVAGIDKVIDHRTHAYNRGNHLVSPVLSTENLFPFRTNFMCMNEWASFLADSPNKSLSGILPDATIANIATKAVVYCTSFPKGFIDPIFKDQSRLSAFLERHSDFPYFMAALGAAKKAHEKIVIDSYITRIAITHTKTVNHLIGVLPSAVHWLSDGIQTRLFSQEKDVKADKKVLEKRDIYTHINKLYGISISKIVRESSGNTKELTHQEIDEALQRTDDRLKAIKTQEAIERLTNQKH